VVNPRSYSRQIGATRRDGHVGEPLREELGDPLLVDRIGITEEEVDRDGHGTAVVLRQALRHGRAQARQRLLGQRRHDGAVFVHAFLDPQTVPVLAERVRLDPAEIVVVLAVQALNEQDILEPGRRDIEDPRPGALVQRIRGDGGAQDQEVDLARRNPRPFQSVEHRLLGRGRRRRPFRGDDALGGGLERNQVRKRAAGVDADAVSHALPPPDACRTQRRNL